MIRFLSEIQGKYTKLAKIVKISISFNRLVFPVKFNWFSQPLTLRLIFSSRTHRISIRLHMQDHNIPLSLLIISVYILTVLVLWNMFSNGHVMVTSCLFLQYDPSTNPKKAGKVLVHSSEYQFFALFDFSKWQLSKKVTMQSPKGQICKYFICYIMFQFF